MSSFSLFVMFEKSTRHLLIFILLRIASSPLKKQEQKEAEREKASNVSSMRVSGPRPLDPDRYDSVSCAVCLKIAAPVLLGGTTAAGAGANAADAAGSAGAADGSASSTEITVAGGGKDAAGGGGVVTPTEVDPTIAECSKCGVRVHRECYGVPEGLGAPGAGERK